jgi:hypothetical protein
MYINEALAPDFGLTDAEQRKFQQDASEVYKLVAKILLAAGLDGTEKAFNNIIVYLTNNVPNLRVIRGGRRLRESTASSLVDLMNLLIPDFDSMGEDERRTEIERLSRDVRRGEVRVSRRAPRTSTRAGDFGSVEKAIDNYKADKSKYFKKIVDKVFEVLVLQIKKDGVDKTLGTNSNLSPRGLEFYRRLRGDDLSPDKIRRTLMPMIQDDRSFKIGKIASMLKIIAAKINANMIRMGTLAEGYELVFDIEMLKEQKEVLNEGFFDMFRSWVKFILQTVLGDFSIPVSVKGNPREVEAFAKAIQGEKGYIDSIKRYGLNNKATYNSRSNLAKSIKGFERETGLQWPFK